MTNLNVPYIRFTTFHWFLCVKCKENFNLLFGIWTCSVRFLHKIFRKSLKTCMFHITFIHKFYHFQNCSFFHWKRKLCRQIRKVARVCNILEIFVVHSYFYFENKFFFTLKAIPKNNIISSVLWTFECESFGFLQIWDIWSFFCFILRILILFTF